MNGTISSLLQAGQSYKMYINGEELVVAGENNGRWFSDLTNHTFSYRIGRSEASPLLGSFNGIVDELRIYKRAMTIEEVPVLYKEGNEGVPTVPLAIRPTVVLSVSSDRIPLGGSVALDWTAKKVTSCMASGSWSGAVELVGVRTFTKLGGDATYTLTCIGEGGSVSSTARVFVDTQSSSVASSTLPSTGTLIVVDATLASPFVRNFSVGARGDEVKKLQLILITRGFLAEGLSTGYFGQLTKAAVVKFQIKHGLPSTGYFGPMTRGKINTME